MKIGEIKVLHFENQTVNILRNDKNIGQNKPIGINSTQSSVLSPQSFNLSTHSFEQICTELLRKGHHVKFRAPGDSMYPTICGGDVITVMPIETGSITIGDIILYRHRSGVTAHRVIRISKNGAHQSQNSSTTTQSSDLSPHSLFILRGDAAINDDAPVSSEQILGKVISIERNGRRIDPYGLRIILHYKIRRFGCRIKRLLLRSSSRSA